MKIINATFYHFPSHWYWFSYAVHNFLFCFPCHDNHNINVCMEATIKNSGYNVPVVEKPLDLLGRFTFQLI